jgi:drug/metabolite transporter (DMT)-like permease
MITDTDSYIGQAAGITTSLLWTATSLLFTAGAKRIGPTAVNGIRIAIAIILLGVTHRLLTGLWVPQVSVRHVLFLATSGIIGLAIGDQALLTSFIYIGPRLAMLIMTTAPLFAAFFGWVALGESLHPFAWLGIALTVGGIAWVLFERPAHPSAVRSEYLARGVILALIGAACQAGGLLLSKQGIGHGWSPRAEHLPPQTATLVRTVFAGIGVAPILAMHWVRTKRHIGDLGPIRIGSPRAGLAFVACGAVVGPFLGVWMSLIATDRAPLGIAQTLCALPPVFLLPFAALIHREKISIRAVLGALIAVGGCAVLFRVST